MEIKSRRHRMRITFRPGAVLSWGLCLGWGFCLAAEPGEDLPRPEKGRWATATVALLQHGHDRCSGVGERILAYWSRLSSSRVQSSLENYVFTRATPELAAGRKALDIARGFLPQAQTEIGREPSLDRLYEAETQLCHVVTSPVPPRSEFEARLEEAEARADELRTRLAVVLQLPEPQKLAKELDPYVEAIEVAAGVARESVKREMQTNRPTRRNPTAQDLMNSWHQGYRQAVAPSKRALSAYLEGRRENDSAAIQEACKALLDAVHPLLGESSVLQAPDPDVREPLELVYKAMRRIATQCTAGRFSEADAAYAWLLEKLRRAAQVLAPYTLQP